MNKKLSFIVLVITLIIFGTAFCLNERYPHLSSNLTLFGLFLNLVQNGMDIFLQRYRKKTIQK